MKSVMRRKQQQEDLRAKILDAARELFITEGVEAASMRKIADKIGYSATTLYNYFEDKEALFYALCEADFGSLHEMFQKIGKIANPIERLRKLGQTYVTFALRYPEQYRFMFMTPRVHESEEPCHEVETENPDQDSYAFVRATVVEALAAGVFRAEYRDADLLAQVVWSAVHGVVALHLIMGEGDWIHWRPAEEVAQTAIDVVIRGLVKSRRGRARSGEG